MTDTTSHSPQSGQVYMAPAQDTYDALLQMLEFSVGFDTVHHDDESHSVTFTAPGVNGMFHAAVTSTADGKSSTVQVSAPLEGGETAQQSVVKFYRDLGDQLMAQTTAATTPIAQPLDTTAADAATQAMPAVGETPTQTLPTASAQTPAESDTSTANSHKATPSGIAALIGDSNPGKTAGIANAALIFGIVFLLLGLLSLGLHTPIAVGIVLFIIAAVLCGVGYVKTQPGGKHGRRRVAIAAMLAVVALILSIIGAAGGSSSSSSSFCKPMEWPSGGVASKAPSIENKNGYIWTDTADYVSMEVCEASESDFSAYVKAAQDKGFTVDYRKGDGSFTAFNADGDKLSASYYSYSKEINIKLSSAKYLKEQEENQSDAEDEEAKKAEEEAEKKAAEEAAAESAEEAKKLEEEQKKAEEEAKKQAEAEKKAEEEAKKAQEQQNNSTGGVSAAVKEAMDSYESAMNKYADFMEKYENEGAPSSMLTDYLDMLNQANDAMKKLDAIDQSGWSTADNDYYLEVMNRVNQRLAQVGGI